MKRAIVVLAAVIVAVSAIFLLLPVRKAEREGSAAGSETQVTKKIAAPAVDELGASLHDQAESKAEAQAEGLPKTVAEMRAKIRDFADSKYFPYAVLSAILNGPFTRDIKFMALQAFWQVHYSKPDEIYKNSDALLAFIDKHLADMDESERGVAGFLFDHLNDDANPNRDAALAYFDEKFDEYRYTDKAKAKLFLNAMMDQNKVKDIMNDKSDKALSEAAQNRLPQIASPMVIKEILQNNRFTPDQQAVGLQRLSAEVNGEDRGNGMTDADALIILAKDLDQKRGTGDKFYKAALQGIGLSKHKNREQFLVNGMKRSLEPLKSRKGNRPYSSVPELSAMLSYLVELPEKSSAYDFFVSELDRMAAAPQCPETEADTALADLISFWQNACEMSVDDCPLKAKNSAYFKTISDKYMTLKNRCPLI